MDILPIINKFETKENIESLNSEYGNLWPLFRITIYFGQMSTVNLKYKNSIYYCVVGFIKDILGFLKYFKKRIKQSDTTLTEDIDELWFSKSSLRKDNKDGFNKYMDPFYLKLSSKKSLIIEIDFEKPKHYKYLSVLGDSKILNIANCYIRYNVRSSFNVNCISFNEFSLRKGIKSIVNEFDSISKYDLFIAYKDYIKHYLFYKNTLSKYKNLKKIFVTGYYGSHNMALISVANSLGIETIDIQHGAVAKEHVAYGSWNYLTTDVMKLIPSTFYVFSNKEDVILNETFGGRCNVKVVGNLMFEEWKSNSLREDNKNIILFTLQNIVIEDNNFILYFFKYIEQNHNNLNIIFRLHPRHSHIKNEIDIVLKKGEINYSWDINSEVYDTLAKTILHITYFSSVVEDSLNLNIPSFILSKQGEKYFSNHIKESRDIFYIDNIDDAIINFNKII